MSKTKKVLINCVHGGFGLSHTAMMEYFNRKGMTVYPDRGSSLWGDLETYYTYWLVPEGERPVPPPHTATEDEFYEYHQDTEKVIIYDKDLKRDDEVLISVVEDLGIGESSGAFGKLKIVEIPADVEYVIGEYGGKEWISEVHRTWS